MNVDEILASVEQTHIEREGRIVETTQNVTFSDDGDINVDDPITSEFMDRGNEAMVTMTNLTIGEFMEIYSDVESEINVVKRGPKPKISPKDSLFMTLVMLKGYFKWEMLSNMFSVKTSVLEKTIKATLESIQPILVQKYIRNIPKDEQDIFGISFPNFKNCIQVVDVCFQPIQKPSGSYSSKKKI